jgi:hypothetical protein
MVVVALTEPKRTRECAPVRSPFLRVCVLDVLYLLHNWRPFSLPFLLLDNRHARQLSRCQHPSLNFCHSPLSLFFVTTVRCQICLSVTSVARCCTAPLTKTRIKPRSGLNSLSSSRQIAFAFLLTFLLFFFVPPSQAYVRRTASTFFVSFFLLLPVRSAHQKDCGHGF